MMNKAKIVLPSIGVCCLFMVLMTNGAPVKVNKFDSGESEGMATALSRGLEVFGGSKKMEAASAVPIQPLRRRIFSQYTHGLHSESGGKPTPIDNRRRHGYFPLAPTVIGRDFTMSSPPTAKETADIVRPSAPLQFASERSIVRI